MQTGWAAEMSKGSDFLNVPSDFLKQAIETKIETILQTVFQLDRHSYFDAIIPVPISSFIPTFILKFVRNPGRLGNKCRADFR